jgi:hypothetical protein
MKICDEPDDVAVPAGIASADWDLKSAALVLAVVVAAFNVASFPLLRGTVGPSGGDLVIVGLVLGVFPAQVGALTLWLVFGSGPFLLRLAAHWGIAFGLFAAWALGCAAAMADGPTRELPEVLSAVVCSLPLVSLAAQLPLWPLRTHLGWRVELPNDEKGSGVLGGERLSNMEKPCPPKTPGPLAPDPLTIRDILVGTVVTAVAVAGLRIFPQIWGRGEYFWEGYWMAWAIGAGVIALVSLLALLPAITMLLRIRDTAGASLAWLGYVATAGFVTVVAIGLIARAGPPPEFIVGLICVFTSFALTLGLPLWIVRAHGWRLVMPRDSNRGPRDSGQGTSER